eukprot:SAG25_NODE_295_length_10249_cov_5.144926_10_plen_173_part_00
MDEMSADGAFRSRMPSLVFSSSLPAPTSPAAACGEPSGYLNDAPCPPFTIHGASIRQPCSGSVHGLEVHKTAACVRAVARQCCSGELGEMGEMGDGGSVGLHLRSAASRAVSPGAAPRNSSYTHTHTHTHTAHTRTAHTPHTHRTHTHTHTRTAHTHGCIISACMLGPCDVH